ncbi:MULTISPECIES: transcription elongation factor GreA [Protofrankia]|uniref:Transcription elongation factor GreA n=1 Tax=Protofrankia coriariae TaxID=1562887 RepID=A0ABR5F8S4_9ACTN|nr:MULTISPECIES: transcription elongation factor GreA [Protofrankia]KLL13094.1 transcription elongation factor GreA [Protofrankia coriariae]ONH38077.1 transcription elongation factor GreA [Protofrankia sp. BMG5.30]
MSQQTWLTQEAYDRLREELDHLTGTGRVEIANKIEAAREEGDLKENGGYHAAKEEQGKLESRIRQLTDLLRDARVGQAPQFDGAAGPGTVVEVRFPGDDETERFLIGSREDHSTSLEVYSAQSPLGGAVSGHRAGDTVTYTLPNGRSATVKIVTVEPYSN